MSSSVLPLDEGPELRPFEWLTSAQSLRETLDEALRGTKQDARVLHVGCGTSILGEVIAENFPTVHQVVNVDKDVPVLQAMERRWANRRRNDTITESCSSKMKFLPVDIGSQPIPLEDGSFDLVVDKSTLDCLLCSDKGASSLISEVYRLLNPDNGVYLLISFHHVDLLRRMLEECPGTHWSFSHSVMYRQVEALIGSGIHGCDNSHKVTTNLEDVEIPQLHSSSAWTSRGFQPDEIYHRTVNVLVGRKQVPHSKTVSQQLDTSKVYLHINECSNWWYQQQHPLLTPERVQQVKRDFSIPQSLEESYHFLFSVEEQEHLTYEAFLEDWETFLRNHPNLVRDELSSETALCFLSEMQ